jgi:2-dehydro-3-deoxyphosphogluconate aldolase/(4S)-4-hydroxy-2-oxoglutarate aldolase
MLVSNTWFDFHFEASPYMAILRGLGRDKTLDLARTAWSTGISLIEVPVQNPNDLETLSALVTEGRNLGKQVGAGTVVNLQQLQAVKDVGATFIVSPGLDVGLIARADDLGLPALPGVGSATDVNEAVKIGLTWLKAFPAISLGSTWIRQMHAPFPQVRFVATGGMNTDNATEFLAAGARGIAIGSAIETLASRASLVS